MSNKNALYEVWEQNEGEMPKLLERFNTKVEAERYVRTQDSEKNDVLCCDEWSEYKYTIKRVKKNKAK